MVMIAVLAAGVTCEVCGDGGVPVMDGLLLRWLAGSDISCHGFRPRWTKTPAAKWWLWPGVNVREPLRPAAHRNPRPPPHACSAGLSLRTAGGRSRLPGGKAVGAKMY